MARPPNITDYVVESRQINSRLRPRGLHLSNYLLQRKNIVRRLKATAILLVALSLSITVLVLVNQAKGRGQYDVNIACDVVTSSGGLEAFLGISNTLFVDLTFGDAKCIDIAWNFTCGQLGRVLFAYISYRVFDDALVKLMETSDTPYDLYITVKMSPVSLSSLAVYAKMITQKEGFRLRSLSIFFLLSSVCVFLWPTLVSATFGYLSPSKEVASVNNGSSFIDLSVFPTTTCWCVYEEGEAGGITAPAPMVLVDMPPELRANHSTILTNMTDWRNPGFRPIWNRNASTWYDINNEPIPKSAMLYANITASYVQHDLDLQTKPPNPPSMDPQSLWINGTEFDISSLSINICRCVNGSMIDWNKYDNNETLHCVQENGYIWGYAWTVLVILISLLICWSFAAFSVWYDANKDCEFNFRGWSRHGGYRAIADLAEAMLDDIGGNSCSYSNDDVQRSLEYLNLRYYQEQSEKRPGLMHVGISSHKRERVQLDRDGLWGGLSLPPNLTRRKTRNSMPQQDSSIYPV